MQIKFNHYQTTTLDINDNTANIQLPNTRDCVYCDMIKLLKYDDVLKDFWHENDIISTTCNSAEYNGTVVLYFNEVIQIRKNHCSVFVEKQD